MLVIIKSISFNRKLDNNYLCELLFNYINFIILHEFLFLFIYYFIDFSSDYTF